MIPIEVVVDEYATRFVTARRLAQLLFDDLNSKSDTLTLPAQYVV